MRPGCGVLACERGSGRLGASKLVYFRAVWIGGIAKVAIEISRGCEHSVTVRAVRGKRHTRDFGEGTRYGSVPGSSKADVSDFFTN